MDGLDLEMQQLTRYGCIGLGLVALMSCGASLEGTDALALRDRVSQVPGLAWLDPVTPVATVGQNQGDTVYLEGEVDQRLPLGGQNLYQLTDDSGSVWVVTPNPPPSAGEPIRIRVTIRYESILVQGQDIGEYYAEELERFEITPESPE
jgi:hypothetical protein